MMFEDWQFGRKLSRLHRTRDRIEKSYAKKMHDSFKARSSHDEKERLINSKQMDLEECDDDINMLTKLFIEPPPRESVVFWFESTTFGGRYLTPAGVTKLRNEIRAERKASWEVIQPKAALIVTLVTALTGLSGAVIGILSFLSKAPTP